MVESARIGRNDPCPCGSGKKYKRCCMARDKAAQAERVGWERAAQDMRAALIGFARESVFRKDVAAGLGLFWQDRYTAENAQMMSVDESLRFFDWFAHDYALRAEGGERSGMRLIEIYRTETQDSLSDKEVAILDGWIASPPGSAFVLESATPDAGTVRIRDLFLADRTLLVHDAAAASHGEKGQILLARPVPEHDDVRLAGATVVLPASETDALLAFLDQAFKTYLGELAGEGAESPETEHCRQRFLRERGYLLTHYALEWAEREGRPAVSAQDPDARSRGSKPLQKVIKWSQERVSTR